MRKLMLAAVMLGASHSAHAADLPFLRGGFSDEPVRRVNWGGAYVGGHATYGSGDMDFSQVSQGPIAKILDHSAFEVNKSTTGLDADDTRISRWRFLDKTSTQSGGIGGFFGYNVQMED